MLKRLFATSALVLGLGVAGFAQKVEKPWAIGLTVGGAFGLGDMGSTKITKPDADGNNDKAPGFAQIGYTTNLNVSYAFHPNIAAAARVGFNSFFTSHSELQKKSKEDYKETGTPGTSMSEFSSSGGLFTGLNALVGPRGSVQAGGIEFYLQPMVGFATLARTDLVTASTIVVDGTNGSATGAITSAYSSTSGLAYGASLGLSTGVTKTVGLLFDITYLDLGQRQFENKQTLVIPSAPGFTSTRTVKDKMSISNLSVNLGVSIHF